MKLLLLLFLCAVPVFAVPPTPTVTPLAFPACPTPNTRIMVLWTYLDSDGQLPASTTFDVDRCTGTGCTSWANIATGVTTQGYMDTGRSAGTVYRYRYRIVDGSGTSGYSPLTADITTAATSDGIVRYPATAGASANGFGVLFGSMTCTGSGSVTSYSPFTWLDSNEDTQATYWKGRTPKHGPGTLTGTISITSGTTAVTGSGTAFLQEVNTADGSPALPAPFHHIYANSTDLGAVASCSSNTSCTLAATYSGATQTAQPGNTSATTQDDQYLNNIYYDLAWTMYINAFRMGTVAAFENARYVADSWFSGRDRQGRGTISLGTPRGSSLGGLMARALDDRPDIWNSLIGYIQSNADMYSVWLIGHRSDGQPYSLRDQGYILLYANFLQQLLPNSYPTSNGTCITLANCGGTDSTGSTARGTLKTRIETDVPIFAGWQQASGVWMIGTNGGAGNAEDHSGSDKLGVTLLMPLLTDALGRIAQNTNLTSTATNSARLQTLRGAAYLGMAAYNINRVDSQPTKVWRAGYYYFGGGMIPNPQEMRYGGNNPPLTIDSNVIRATRQNGCTVPNTLAHAFALSGATVYKTLGEEYLNALFAQSGENTGGTGDGEHNLSDGTDGKNYSECYRAGMQMLGRRLESPSSLGTPPVANAGSDVTLTGGQNVVTLSSTSGTCTNTPCTSFWTMSKGPIPVGWFMQLPYIVSSTTNTPTMVNLDPGTYTFKKITIDALGLADDDDMILTVGAGVLKPTVQCGEGTSLPGDYIIQRASGSTAFNLAVLAYSTGTSESFTYAWTLSQKPKNVANPTIGSPTGTTTAITIPSDGDYLFKVVATGSTSGLTQDCYAPITVHRASDAIPTSGQNTVPMVRAGVNQVLPSGTTSAYLIANAVDAKTWQTYANGTPPTGYQSNNDANRLIRNPGTHSWACTSGCTGITFSNSTTITPTVNGLTNGAVVVVTDTYSDGTDTATGSITITVLGGASTYYASTTGSGSTCSLASPCTLATAITKPSPGDTVYLRAGTYSGAVKIIVDGTSLNHIYFKAYPGERAILDNPWVGDDDQSHSIVWVEGDYIELWNLEFKNSNTAHNDYRPTGISLTGLRPKVIDCIVYDAGNGIFPSSSTQGAEIDGLISFNNGWVNATYPQGAGHGAYGQNDTNTQIFRNSVFFNNYNLGFQFYSGSTPVLVGLTVDDCVFFNNGSPIGAVHDAVVIGGVNVPADNITVTDNSFYKGGLILGYTYTANGTAVATGNTFGGTGGMQVSYWASGAGLTLNTNKFGVGGNSAYVIPVADKTKGWLWNNNSYFTAASTPFDISGQGQVNFTNWKSNTGFDAASSFTSSAPTGADVFIKSSSYDTDRWLVVIHNWSATSTVSVNPSSVLSSGNGYRLVNVQDPNGTAVLTGTYTSGSLTVPMTGLTVQAPAGASAPASVGPDFGVFLLLRTSSGAATPSSVISGKAVISGKVVF